jgi:hypothetical protein
MMRRIGWMTAALTVLAACSDSHEPTPGSQTHFVTCQVTSDCSALGAKYACESGRCVPVSGMHATPGADAGKHDSGTTPTNSGSTTQGVDAGSAADAGMRTPICDGSNDIRLAIFISSGYGNPLTDMFMQPFGIFAAIDGHCRYYATWTPMRGVVTGTLDSMDADQLATDIQWDEFASFGGYMNRDPDCSDGGGATTTDGKRSFACLCGCDPAAPTNLEPATIAAENWAMRLASEGTGVDGPVSAAATVFGGGVPPRGGTLPPGDPQAWPLASSITDILATENDLGSGQRFDDPSDSAALRAMRSTAFMNFADARQIYATDGAQDYLLYVRDELDPDVQPEISAFHTAAVGVGSP